MKTLNFFATQADLLPVLDAVDAGAALQYVRTGNFTSSVTQRFTKGRDLPELGIASSTTASTCASWLVAPADQRIHIRTLSVLSSPMRYLVDQMENPDTIVLTPAGLWQDEILLHGRIATVSETPEAKTLMALFAAEIRRGFKTVKAFAVGPEAMAMLAAGTRLTISAQSPRDFDLQPG